MGKFIIVILHVVRYGINAYIFYNMCINPYPDIVYRNILVIWRPKLLEILIVLNVGFEVQKAVEYYIIERYLSDKKD